MSTCSCLSVVVEEALSAAVLGRIEKVEVHWLYITSGRERGGGEVAGRAGADDWVLVCRSVAHCLSEQDAELLEEHLAGVSLRWPGTSREQGPSLLHSNHTVMMCTQSTHGHSRHVHPLSLSASSLPPSPPLPPTPNS
jgi:hypothetical protein